MSFDGLGFNTAFDAGTESLMDNFYDDYPSAEADVLWALEHQYVEFDDTDPDTGIDWALTIGPVTPLKQNWLIVAALVGGFIYLNA